MFLIYYPWLILISVNSECFFNSQMLLKARSYALDFWLLQLARQFKKNEISLMETSLQTCMPRILQELKLDKFCWCDYSCKNIISMSKTLKKDRNLCSHHTVCYIYHGIKDYIHPYTILTYLQILESKTYLVKTIICESIGLSYFSLNFTVQYLAQHLWF